MSKSATGFDMRQKISRDGWLLNLLAARFRRSDFTTANLREWLCLPERRLSMDEWSAYERSGNDRQSRRNCRCGAFQFDRVLLLAHPPTAQCEGDWRMFESYEDLTSRLKATGYFIDPVMIKVV